MGLHRRVAEHAGAAYPWQPKKLSTGQTSWQYGTSSGLLIETARGMPCRMEKDAKSGQFRPVEVPGSEKVLEADIVLLAMGFTGPEERLATSLGIKTDERSNFKVRFTTTQDALAPRYYWLWQNL